MHGSFTDPRLLDDAADSVLLESNGTSVAIPDSLLFNGEFKRSGDSLKITGADGKSVYIVEYFKADQLATLVGPNGAVLNADLVEALAGPLAPHQYAQAGAPAPSAQPQPQIGAV